MQQNVKLHRPTSWVYPPILTSLTFKPLYAQAENSDVGSVTLLVLELLLHKRCKSVCTDSNLRTVTPAESERAGAMTRITIGIFVSEISIPKVETYFSGGFDLFTMKVVRIFRHLSIRNAQ